MAGAAIALTLTGCASNQVATMGAAINDEARTGAEFVLCQGISVGAWRRAYGDSQDRADAWRRLCAEAKQTP
jgi:hypothetical protein